MAIERRVLGRGAAALEVGALGLGCMGMTASDGVSYGPIDEAQARATILYAIDAGADLLDTAEMYGPFVNEAFVGSVIKGRRDRVVVSTKFGQERLADQTRRVNGRPDYVRRAVEGSLQRLGVDVIDLYYQHRVDPTIAIEETWGALHDLVLRGKVRFLGISEPGIDSLRRAHAVHPVTALQNEWSLWARDIEADGVLRVARELGIGIVAYCPLGRGLLAGRIRAVDDLAQDDNRRRHPRFQGDNLARNVALVDRVVAIAARHGCTPGQMALSWLLAQGCDVVPIPGTKRVAYLNENLGALAVRLGAEDRVALAEAIPIGAGAGARYPEAAMRTLGI